MSKRAACKKHPKETKDDGTEPKAKPEPKAKSEPKPDTKAASCAVLPKKLAPNTPLTLVIGGLEYEGTFVRSLGPVLQLRDSFEDSYAANRAVEAATLTAPKHKEAKAHHGAKQKIDCGDPEPVLRKVLSS